MPRPALVLLIFALVACSGNDTASSRSQDRSPIAMEGWRTERGAIPTRAEFAAVVASCQDRAQTANTDLDSCLADMGLRRSQ